jgi:dynein heavy chain 1
MTKPDNELIAQVLLFAQGFSSAELLASKAVSFFTLCRQQLSAQQHYDWGLRALKSVLVSAGNLKRKFNPVQSTQRTPEEVLRFELGVLLQSKK